MMIPFKYSVKSLFTRRLTMALTVFGIILVVFVFTGVLMMTAGLKKTLVASGSDNNVIVIREASATEMQSFVSRYQAGVIETLPEIAYDENERPIVAGEVVILISKKKIGSESQTNLMVRGVDEMSLKVHEGVLITEGRMFGAGKTEIIVGRKISEGFQGSKIGDIMRFGNTDWKIVGVFEAGGASFESEVWGDVNQFMAAFGRPVYSSMIFRMSDLNVFDEMRERVMADPRMTVDMKREKKYYADQSYSTTQFVSILGTTISIIFSLGAIIGAMITMYAAVSNRTTEIATMRALGFKRRSILSAFLVESIMISVIGGIIGLLCASLLQFVNISTMNFDTFSDITFRFALSPEIALTALIFSLLMGFFGGFLPAVRASRIKIVDALKAE
ncbi:MAG: FtsX-like permease family protein [candidate division Zixibacteria bacterium]|nr:FtsX-like permease family protein [candidate division Zixibacteria bacterium]